MFYEIKLKVEKENSKGEMRNKVKRLNKKYNGQK